jgi:hypothetical protein
VPLLYEFGGCGNSFSPQDPNNSQNDGISGVINIGVAWDAVWGALSRTGGCAIVGVGKGFQSFFGLPAGMQNGPPDASTVLRAGRGAYKIGTPGMMVGLGKAGPLGRLVGDAIPGFGEFLGIAQSGLAINDGGKAAYDCVSK